MCGISEALNKINLLFHRCFFQETESSRYLTFSLKLYIIGMIYNLILIFQLVWRVTAIEIIFEKLQTKKKRLKLTENTIHYLQFRNFIAFFSPI
jgi:hypothetical protein